MAGDIIKKSGECQDCLFYDRVTRDRGSCAHDGLRVARTSSCGFFYPLSAAINKVREIFRRSGRSK